MPSKTPISIRLDTELLDWLRSRSDRYQTLIQTILRDYQRIHSLAAARQIGRAQEIFKQYYAQCFWHYSPDLIIDSSNFELVINGLKKYGGRKGILLAEELCQ